jgi:hypothetical protein
MRHLLLLWLAACGGSDFNPVLVDAAGGDSASADGAPGCSVSVDFDPPMPLAFAGSRVRATAHVENAPGVLGYSWLVRRNTTVIAFDNAATDMSAVDFDVALADSYETLVQVTGTSQPCPATPFFVNSTAPGAKTTQIRVRVYPPSSVAAPPNEKLVLVNGGGNASIGVVTVDPGQIFTGTTGAQAYLRFIPVGARDAYVEGFTAASGAFSVRLINQPYDVLVVPTVPGFAPRLFASWLPGANLPLDGGTLVTGHVQDHTDAPLAAAKVQLVVGGVPATLATTDASGNFSVRTSVASGAASIEVTAPAATGLPRLVASGTLGSGSLTVDYANAIAIRDLGGAVVRRSGTAQANAQVTIAGTFASAGTVSGALAATASGEVRASAIADASGVLPPLRAPDRLLSAVTVINNTATMSAIDLRGAVPALVDAPPLAAITTRITNTTGAILDGAILEARPKGVLAMAGADEVRAIANASGDVTAALAPGGTYDLLLVDPRGHEPLRVAAPRRESDQTAADILSVYALPKGLQIKGTIVVAGTQQPIDKGAVQVLCATGAECTGTVRALPLAEGASSSAGQFAVAVIDPGTM